MIFFSQIREGHREPLVEFIWNDPLALCRCVQNIECSVARGSTKFLNVFIACLWVCQVT